MLALTMDDAPLFERFGTSEPARASEHRTRSGPPSDAILDRIHAESVPAEGSREVRVVYVQEESWSSLLATGLLVGFVGYLAYGILQPREIVVVEPDDSRGVGRLADRFWRTFGARAAADGMLNKGGAVEVYAYPTKLFPREVRDINGAPLPNAPDFGPAAWGYFVDLSPYSRHWPHRAAYAFVTDGGEQVWLPSFIPPDPKDKLLNLGLRERFEPGGLFLSLLLSLFLPRGRGCAEPFVGLEGRR